MLQAIDHNVLVVVVESHNNNNNGPSSCELMLTFPPFRRSLEYDPSISLGLLLGHDSNEGG